MATAVDIVERCLVRQTTTVSRIPAPLGKPWTDMSSMTPVSIEFAFLVDWIMTGRLNELLPQFGDKKAPLAWYELKGGKFEKHVCMRIAMGMASGQGT